MAFIEVISVSTYVKQSVDFYIILKCTLSGTRASLYTI